MRLAAVVAAFVSLLGLTEAARGSVIVARDASAVEIAGDANGRALLTYRQGGTVRHVIANGATDSQTTMRLDYSGGRGAWRSFGDRSRPYDGPSLPWLVTAVKAPDGSYWALQAWQRKLPNKGLPPGTARQRAGELHLSHWRGAELPKLEVWVDWVYRGRFKHLFGHYTYRGEPVFGTANTPGGVPLDRLGRSAASGADTDDA